MERLANLPSLFSQTLTDAMAALFTLGWMIGAFVLILGIIFYLTGWDEHRGKRMIFGGFILFMLFLYLDLGFWIGPGGQGLNETQSPSPTP